MDEINKFLDDQTHDADDHVLISSSNPNSHRSRNGNYKTKSVFSYQKPSQLERLFNLSSSRMFLEENRNLIEKSETPIAAALPH
jgi:hypothetical protein